ncbi:MAG TPA: YqgE/AlgH family protein [Kineosporiaceae bacterium]|nr:YqgE/AlgH family protein [Kineosporiaceae bacterium]
MTGLVGRLLVATPVLEDPNFRRTVVLMLDHNAEGALGIVVNRPLAVDVSAVLPSWQRYTTAPGRLFQGGPVALDSALGVVAVPGDDEEPMGVKRIIGSLGLVDLDIPPEIIVGGVAGLRIFAGYAGWSAGQLEGEITEGAWYVVDAEPRDPFTDAPELLWRQVLRRQRGELAFVSTFPEDPTMN